jgi:DNA-binding MarR family transcriptional regulator
MSTDPRTPFIGSMSRLVWQWVRREIYDAVVAAGYQDLTPAHVAVFRYPSSDGKRPTELAVEMQITRQSVNGLLGHLERCGYLVREPDPADSRIRRIRLTRLGRAVEDVTTEAAERAERRAGEILGDDRLQELRRSLAQLVMTFGATHHGEPSATGIISEST